MVMADFPTPPPPTTTNLYPLATDVPPLPPPAPAIFKFMLNYE